MKKMTKWLAVCAVCVMGSVPAMAAEVPDVTVTPIPIETPAPDVTPIETPAPTPIPEVKNGWYEYGTKNKKYFKKRVSCIRRHAETEKHRRGSRGVRNI